VTDLPLAYRRSKEGRCPVCGSPYTTPAIVSELGGVGVKCCECGYNSLNLEHAFMLPVPYKRAYEDRYDRVFPPRG
jgi:hypothetical protein